MNTSKNLQMKNAGNCTGKLLPRYPFNQSYMKYLKILYIAGLLSVFLACQNKPLLKTAEVSNQKAPVMLGIDNFLQNYLYLVKDKRVGLLTNPSGVNGANIASSDLLNKEPGVTLTALFGPEHGIRGAIEGGEKIEDIIDERSGVSVYSLYGRQRKPTPEMLQNVDLIIIDIQDIGIRAYTYIYTMAMVMQAALENDKQVLILDRPNPQGGLHVEGNLLDPAFNSFVGLYPIPYLHGLTIGELALLFNSEFGIGCRLKVIPMQGWKRSMNWGDTKLVWVPTSPHVPHWQTIYYMGATGPLGELGVLSTGVGYTSPFELVGAPWIDGQCFADTLNRLGLPGIYFRPLFFKPYYLHHKDSVCQGVQLHITDQHTFNPYLTGLKIMEVYIRQYPLHPLFANEQRIAMFDKVVGTDQIRQDLMSGISAEQIQKAWQPALGKFLKVREKYLIYH